MGWRWGMGRRSGLVLALGALVLGLGLPAQSRADSSAPPITQFLHPCGQCADQILSGSVPSFDGTLLDVDLTLPSTGSSGQAPLMVFLHGFGNNKHEWESVDDEADGHDKWHWNSHWFSEHGFYVLTYTARGFSDTGPSHPYQPPTASYSSRRSQGSGQSATIHLKSRDFEIHDTEWLAGLVAASFAVDRHRLAVSGGSYGGGESWTLASHATTNPPAAIAGPYLGSPAPPSLELQVAVPKYPWSDLGYSLAPNGHGGGVSATDIYESATGKLADQVHPEPNGIGNPVGVAKASYVTGFFAEGAAGGDFEDGFETTVDPNSTDPPPNVNLAAWFARVMGQGESYELPPGSGIDEFPLVAQIRRGLTKYRSAYYQPTWQDQVGKREVAVFSISGWTDDLFPPVESFRMFKYLKRLDPRWPVSVGVADVGHPRAQNKASTWHHLNDQAWQFLKANINGSHQQQTTVFSMPTVCATGSDQDQALDQTQRLTATTPEGLSNGTLTIQYTGGVVGMTAANGLLDIQNGLKTDPVFSFLVEPGQPCRTSDRASPSLGGYTGYSVPLPQPEIFVGLGYVNVPYMFTGTPADQDTLQLDARVWDVDPSGKALIVTRGTYRIDPPFDGDGATAVLKLPLFGNQWTLEPGHQVRLDLNTADTTFLRPSNSGSTLSIHDPTLVLPIRNAADEVLAGSPGF